MKTRLNLTIEKDLLEDIKEYAASQQTSVSELVEEYFKKISRPERRVTVIELVDKLQKPDLDKKADLKELYYTEQSGKYGI